MAVAKQVEQDRNRQSGGDLEPIAEVRNFDPARHLIRLPRGGEYLEVKWRLLWLRLEHPDAHIETELVHFDPEKKLAVFKARIVIPEGGSATGWGSESSDDFKDFIEKAETKALGRACAALGFGTQHSQDYDYDNQGGRVVDAPVSYPATSNGYNRSPAPISNGAVAAASSTATTDSVATERQVKYLYVIGRDQGLSEEQVVTLCKEKFGVVPEKLPKGSVNRMIEMLKPS